MAEQPVPSRPTPRPEAGGRWRTRDLSLRMAEHHISPAVLEAAMQDAHAESVGSPDEAKALVDAFLKRPIARTYP